MSFYQSECEKYIWKSCLQDMGKMNGDCLLLVMLTLPLSWPRPQCWGRSCPRWLAPSAGTVAGRFHSPASWSGWSPPSPVGCWKGCWDWSTGCNWWAASEKKRRTPPGSCGTKWANRWVHGPLIHPSYSQNQLSVIKCHFWNTSVFVCFHENDFVDSWVLVKP